MLLTALQQHLVHKAISEAKLRGELVPQWRNGKVVWVRPEEIELPAAQEDQAEASNR